MGVAVHLLSIVFDVEHVSVDTHFQERSFHVRYSVVYCARL